MPGVWSRHIVGTHASWASSGAPGMVASTIDEQLGPPRLAHMLVGRNAECARIDELLTEARRGRSGALVLAGEPGIGKSALCDYSRRCAKGEVLYTRSVESE